MAPALLAAIDLLNYTESTRGLDAQQLSFVANIYTSATPDTVDQALTHLQRSVGRYTNYLGVATLSSIDDVLSLLDAGAAKVFVTRQQLDELLARNIDQDRIVLCMPGNTKEEIIDAIAGTQVDIYSHQVQDVALLEAWLHEYGTHRPEVFVSFLKPQMEDILRISRLSAIPVIPAQALTVDVQKEPELLGVAKLLMANATSDRPDGLFTTLVTDERGTALGLVYSNEESVAESLRVGRGVYHSRKRGLWYKGESSGDVQELVSLSLDCDNDCLQFVVRQKGRGDCVAKCVLSTTDVLQASATSPRQRVSETIVVYRDSRRRSRAGKSLPRPARIPLDCSTTPSYYEPRSSKKLPSSVTQRQKRRSPLRLPTCYTLP
jgi:phosphoribosyl-ATP pyrophosphohydrolase/phosphoribosyl-AMP cyclohydrolase/histidinol dehydrogenase